MGSGSFGKVAKVLRIFKETEDGPILKWPYACKKSYIRTKFII